MRPKTKKNTVRLKKKCFEWKIQKLIYFRSFNFLSVAIFQTGKLSKAHLA